MHYKVIIWDLDGTLLDTLGDLFLAVNHALRTYGKKERTLEEVRQFVGNGVRQLMKRAVEGGEDDPQFEDIFAEFKRYYVQHCHDNTAPYEGIKSTLSALKARGVRMAIVSNKLQPGVTELHKRWFADTIEVAIGETPDVKRKPAPDMVEKALRLLGVAKEDAVYIGDSEVDIATAQNASLPCISVLWGFRTREELGRASHPMVERPEEILDKM